MSVTDDLYDVILDRLTDPGTVDLVRRALAQNVVLDTWMNGEREEAISDEAEEIISDAAEAFTRRAVTERAVFPHHPMPEGYVRAAFYEILSGTALYQAQKRTGVREVDTRIARDAVGMLRQFTKAERDGLTAAGGYFFIISAHEDLNAIHYYKRMRREDFLLGTLHRPWSDMMLTNQLELYQAAELVKRIFTSEGEMLELTSRGEEILRHLQNVLEEAGEFEWRSNAQRWVIFGETDYDRVLNTILPNAASNTDEYVQELPIPYGARVLEIGAGTGRVTFDHGLADRVAAAGGTLVALEPSGALLKTLRSKSIIRGVPDVEIVQGVAEDLPFDDNVFDLVVAVAVLHFTELERAVAEMMRVTKPGGLVTAAMMKFDVLEIPMVSMWFQPLKVLAAELGVPAGERLGLPPGVVEEQFRSAGLEKAETRCMGKEMKIYAGDYRSFLHFVLKGGAFFQNVLSRLPFQERWGLIRLMEETGRELAAATSHNEQEVNLPGELVYGWKPTALRKGGPTVPSSEGANV